MPKVLIVQFSSDRNGSTLSGLSLANGLREQGWATLVAFGHPGPMVADYQQAGHATCVIEHKNWLRRSQSLRFLKDVLAEWRKAKPFEAAIVEFGADVVYVNTIASLSAALAARRCGAKLVWHLRELFSDVGGEMQAPSWGRALARLILMRWASVVVVNSRAVATNLLGEKGASRAMVVPNAVPEASFENAITRSDARRQLGLPIDARIVGVPGTLRPVKGHEFFFRAVAGLPKKYPDLLFAVTGDGDRQFVEVLKGQVKHLGLEHNTLFLGSLKGLDVFYRACDVICVPSASEPFGRVVIEAFAAGKPVVATDVGGIPEIISNGKNGILVPYGNELAFARAVDDLILKPELATALGTEALRGAEVKYRESNYQSAIVEIVNAA